MSTVIKNFIFAGIGGAVAYGVVDAVISALVTGTDAAALMFQNIVPLVVAAGVVWLIVANAFKE